MNRIQQIQDCARRAGEHAKAACRIAEWVKETPHATMAKAWALAAQHEREMASFYARLARFWLSSHSLYRRA